MEVVVVGGGDSAAEEALFLTRFCSKVTLIHRQDSLRASQIMAQRVLEHPKIEMAWNSAPTEFLADEQGFTRAVQLKDTVTGALREVPCKGALLLLGIFQTLTVLPTCWSGMVMVILSQVPAVR